MIWTLTLLLNRPSVLSPGQKKWGSNIRPETRWGEQSPAVELRERGSFHYSVWGCVASEWFHVTRKRILWHIRVCYCDFFMYIFFYVFCFIVLMSRWPFGRHLKQVQVQVTLFVPVGKLVSRFTSELPLHSLKNRMITNTSGTVTQVKQLKCSSANPNLDT